MVLRHGRRAITICGIRHPMTPLGRFSPVYKSWLWAWANEEFPARACEASRHLRGLYELTGFRIFLSPGFPATGNDVNDLRAAAVHQLTAIGFFRCTSDGPTLYLAVHEADVGDVKTG